MAPLTSIAVGNARRIFNPKIKLEVVVSDALSGPVSAAIVEVARTGSIDDGNIFISQVDEAIRTARMKQTNWRSADE